MAKHNEIGQAGEKLAKEYFITKGYTIRDSNWRCGRLELDLVVEKDGYVVFVEVKTRTGEQLDPTFGIDDRKVRNVINAGKGYLKMYNLPQLSMQIDIVTIVWENGEYQFTHYEDAVTPKLLKRRR